MAKTILPGALGAADVPAAEETGRSVSRPALGRSPAETANAVGGAGGRVPQGVSVHPPPHEAHAVSRVQTLEPADRQRRDRGRLQDRRHAASEAFGHAVDETRGANAFQLAGGVAQWHLATALPPVPASSRSRTTANLWAINSRRHTPSRLNVRTRKTTPSCRGSRKMA